MRVSRGKPGTASRAERDGLRQCSKTCISPSACFTTHRIRKIPLIQFQNLHHRGKKSILSTFAFSQTMQGRSQVAEQALPIATRIAPASGGVLVLLRVVGFPIEVTSYPAAETGVVQSIANDVFEEATAYLKTVNSFRFLSGYTSKRSNPGSRSSKHSLCRRDACYRSNSGKRTVNYSIL